MLERRHSIANALELRLSCTNPSESSHCFQVLGMDGLVRNENMQDTGLEVGNKAGILKDPYQYSFPERYRESYANALQHFAEVLAGTEEIAFVILSWF